MRKVGDYAAYAAALRPRLRAFLVKSRNARTARSAARRIKPPGELRALIACALQRRARWETEGIMVSTGPRSWRIVIPPSMHRR